MIASTDDADLVSEMAEVVAAQYSVSADSIFGTTDKRKTITDARRAFHWCCVRLLDIDAYRVSLILGCNRTTVRESVEHVDSLERVGQWTSSARARAMARVEWRR